MTRHANCPWCADDGPHVVRGRRPAQLLTDTVIIRLDCRMCSSAFEIQETATPASALPPGAKTVSTGTAAGVAHKPQ